MRDWRVKNKARILWIQDGFCARFLLRPEKIGLILLLAVVCQGFTSGVIASNLRLEKHACGIKFTEGLVCDASGSLFSTGQSNDPFSNGAPMKNWQHFCSFGSLYAIRLRVKDANAAKYITSFVWICDNSPA